MLTGTVPPLITSRHCTTGAGSFNPVIKNATATIVAISGAEIALLMLMPLESPLIMATPRVYTSILNGMFEMVAIRRPSAPYIDSIIGKPTNTVFEKHTAKAAIPPRSLCMRSSFAPSRPSAAGTRSITQ